MKKILNYLGNNYEAIFLGAVIANLTWWVQPRWSQGLQLVKEGVQSTFLLVAFLYFLCWAGMKLYFKYKKIKDGSNAFHEKDKGVKKNV